MRVSVVCIGNELLMDEGIGPACARYLLSRYRFPDEVTVLDRACMGMAIISDLRECDFMLVLDAVNVPQAQPGDLFSFAPEDVAATPAGMTSLHDVRFADVLGAAELLGIKRAGHCLGIQVENMSPSEFVVALTPRVAAALPLMAQAAVRYLRRELGIEVVDLLADTDPLRAGLDVAGARDFSQDGARMVGGPAGEGTVVPVLPAVYGEPDVTVMARYLAEGLAAVGAEGAWGARHAGGPCLVTLRLPVETSEQRERAEAIARTYGLDAVTDGLERTHWAAWVSPATTDYDCDALVGACQKAVAQARGETA